MLAVLRPLTGLVRAAAPSVAVRAMSGRASLAHGGGSLVDHMIKDPKEKTDLVASCESRIIDITERQSCDVELIINGGFNPLDGFMDEKTYTSVVENVRTPSGTLFGLPVVFDTAREDVKPGQNVLLRYNNQDIAVFSVKDKYTPDKPKEAKLCYGTSSLEHPGVQMIAMERGKYYLGGELRGLELPKRVFPCMTPAEVRAMLPSVGDIVAFQCRNPIHRAHYELFMRSLSAPNVSDDAVVLVHPTCGPTQPDDIPGLARYHTYERLREEIAQTNNRVYFAYLPYSMHMAGPREAIQHMLIRKNYGATAFIVGRDMAGSKSSIDGEDFYGAYDAQEFAKKHEEELIKTVPSLNLVYTAEKGYITADQAKEEGLKPMKLSGTEFRRRLRAGEDIPDWFAFKSVVEVLRRET